MKKQLGSTLLITGTAIGAAILGLPIASGSSGFLATLITLIAIWLLMTYTGLLVLEVNLKLPLHNNSFMSMAQKTCGNWAAGLTWISLLLLLYALTGAYISGDASLLSVASQHFFNYKLSSTLNASLFTLVFGGVVFWSTRAVDMINRFFISFKGFFIILTLALLMPKIQLHNLHSPWPHSHLIAIMAPIFLTSFGYHHIIPSLTNYIGKDSKILRRVIIQGAAIPFVIYLLWLIATLGVIPQHGALSFSMLAKHNNVGNLTQTISNIVNNPVLSFSVNCFANIAMITSFLGVTLGLFDFLADSCKRNNSRFGRLQTAILTFLPPLVFSIFYPNGFLLALGFAAIFVSFLEVILPALMAHASRRQRKDKTDYRVSGGWPMLVIVIFAGIGLIVMDVL